MSRGAHHAVRTCLLGGRACTPKYAANTWAVSPGLRFSRGLFSYSSRLTGVVSKVPSNSRIIRRPRLCVQYGLTSRSTYLCLRQENRVSDILSCCGPPMLAAPLFLVPLLALFKSATIAKFFTASIAFLKSSTFVKVVGAISKVSFSAVASLRLMARRILRWWHGEENYKRMRLERRKQGIRHRHFKRTISVLVWVPFTLIGLVFLASMERTPVWGRWRVILLSTDEEALLLKQFLLAGGPPDAKLEENVPRDWLSIMRSALGDEGPEGTLGGLQVLDPAKDWRAAWAKDVFSKLQDGISTLNLTEIEEEQHDDVHDIAGTRYIVKPPVFPLSVRPSTLKAHGETDGDAPTNGPLLTRYGVLVVDGPLCNAFSIGFGPARMLRNGNGEEAPGVVVIYTGLLDAILQGRVCQVTEGTNSLSKVFGLFGSIAATPVQPVGPTKYETDKLASIIAHELAHVLLSHSLESIAADNAYDLLTSIATDLIRAALYPLTAILGPAFNDWFGEQVRANSALGLKIKSSCTSRKAEFEADLLGLRILLGANIDPSIALDVWGPQGLFANVEASQTEAAQRNEEDQNPGDPFSAEGWLDRNGFMLTHPPNDARYRRIKQELDNWKLLSQSTADGTQQ